MNETNLTKEDFWMKRIQDFQKSGLSRKEWCQENQVPLSTFSYWIRKQMQKPSELDQGMEPVFARLPSELEVSSQPLSEYPPITIHLPEIYHLYLRIYRHIKILSYSTDFYNKIFYFLTVQFCTMSIYKYSVNFSQQNFPP